MDELVNRIEQSGLIQLDLSHEASAVGRAELDLAPALWQGLALREKDFRHWLKALDGTPFAGCAVALHCSAEAVLPEWAWMLATQAIHAAAPTVHSVHHCAPADLGGPLLLAVVEQIDVETYRDALLVVKGCGLQSGPTASMRLIERLRPVVKSLMFGEACSTVPIYKRPRS
jgi:hypothetical protein